jgi:pantoate--beta-alanine ligase
MVVEIVEAAADIRVARARMRGEVGVVPTMGALHEGHLALVRRAREENAHVIPTIFVNPTQFNDPKDLLNYPRDTERDLELLRGAGVDVVFMPTPEVMYPPNFQTYVTVENVTQGLEGAHRPGHFRGVATVVAKLFNLTQPHRAYFGQKDAQQVAVIKRMVADLNIPLDVVVCPTLREADGLAMSSRNRKLTPEQRQAAPVLYRALIAAQLAFDGGERDPEVLRQVMRAVLVSEPLAEVDYVSVADADILDELREPIMAAALVSLAAKLGSIRLIDNLILG